MRFLLKTGSGVESNYFVTMSHSSAVDATKEIMEKPFVVAYAHADSNDREFVVMTDKIIAIRKWQTGAY